MVNFHPFLVLVKNLFSSMGDLYYQWVSTQANKEEGIERENKSKAYILLIQKKSYIEDTLNLSFI